MKEPISQIHFWHIKVRFQYFKYKYNNKFNNRIKVYFELKFNWLLFDKISIHFYFEWKYLQHWKYRKLFLEPKEAKWGTISYTYWKQGWNLHNIPENNIVLFILLKKLWWFFFFFFFFLENFLKSDLIKIWERKKNY